MPTTPATRPPAGYPSTSPSGGVPGRQNPSSSGDDRFGPEADPDFVASSGDRTPGFNFVTQQGGPGYGYEDVQAVYSWAPDAIFELQRQLQAGGWISGDIGQPGVWDSGSQQAFHDLLVYANGLGVYYKDALTQSISAYEAGSALEGTAGYSDRFGSGGRGGSALAPLTISLPNIEDVKRGLEQVARDETNVDLGDEFYTAKAEEYLDMLRTIQMNQGEAARRAAQISAFGGDPGTLTSTEPPSLETFAEQAVEKEAPGKVRTADVGDAEDVLVDVMTRSYG